MTDLVIAPDPVLVRASEPWRFGEDEDLDGLVQDQALRLLCRLAFPYARA